MFRSWSRDNEPNVSVHRRRYRLQNYRHDCRRRQNSVAGRQLHQIVAGHGPLGNTADLTKSRDMLITSRDRVQKLKSAQEAVAEKAFADLDPVWGQGIINSDQWIQIVYLTL